MYQYLGAGEGKQVVSDNFIVNAWLGMWTIGNVYRILHPLNIIMTGQPAQF